TPRPPLSTRRTRSRCPAYRRTFGSYRRSPNAPTAALTPREEAMRIRHLLALATASVTALGMLAACGGSPNANRDANRNPGGVLNIGMPNGPQTENHNPFLASSSAASLGYRHMIYEPLVMSNMIRPADP